MTDDLVERVGRELARTGYAFTGIDLTDPYTADADYWNSQARAAIAVVLQEAAKVAENASFHFTQTTPSTVEVVDVRHTIAAAIRALIPQET